MTLPMEAGTRHEVRVSGITSEGAGVGRLPDGRAIFVHRTAPGDLARVEVDSLRSRWARGHLVELLEPGPDRRQAPCPFYARCGGCTLEHLTYPAQLAVKRGLVCDALKRIGKRTELPEASVHASPREMRYRNRVTFTLRRSGGDAVAAGFHEIEKPDRIADVDGRCLLPEAAISEAWNALRAGWGTGACSLPAGRSLRLTLRGAESGGVLLLVEGGRGRGDPDRLVGAVPNLRAIWQRRAEPGAEPVLLAGEERLEEVWCGEEVGMDPSAFLQVNREAGSILHDHVLREAGPARGRRVLDAYCGVGAYGKALAKAGATCVGIELDRAAVRTAERHPTAGFRVIRGRVEDRLSEALPADLVILNPPRTGAARGVMEAIAEARPPRIVYVSCDPATLARDVERLGPSYGIARLQLFDLFPQTAHVETVLTLEPVVSLTTGGRGSE